MNKEIIDKVERKMGIPMRKDIHSREFCLGDMRFYGNEAISIKETEILKMIDDNWEELTFDMHMRFCRMADVGGRTQKMCKRFKEQLKEELKERIKGK